MNDERAYIRTDLRMGVQCKPMWVEEDGIVVTSWSHLELWRETIPKWMVPQYG